MAEPVNIKSRRVVKAQMARRFTQVLNGRSRHDVRGGEASGGDHREHGRESPPPPPISPPPALVDSRSAHKILAGFGYLLYSGNVKSDGETRIRTLLF